jgi:hypothetical protein
VIFDSPALGSQDIAMTELNPEMSSAPEEKYEVTTADVVEFLKRLEPGRYEYDLWKEMARLNTICTVELVPFRVTDDGKLQVLLTQRPKGDIWEFLWHIPGSVMYATDKIEHEHDYSDAFERIYGDGGELGDGVQTIGTPTYVDSHRRKTLRGSEYSAITWVEVTGDTATGQSVDMDGFPGNVPVPGIISHQVSCITLAAQHFAATRGLSSPSL